MKTKMEKNYEKLDKNRKEDKKGLIKKNNGLKKKIGEQNKQNEEAMGNKIDKIKMFKNLDMITKVLLKK